MPEEKIVSATDAVRKFSEILNFVKYKGVSFRIYRGRKPVATLRPLEPIQESRPDEKFEAKQLDELKKVLKNLPKLGSEAEGFERDVKKILQFQPSLPKKSPWE